MLPSLAMEKQTTKRAPAQALPPTEEAKPLLLVGLKQTPKGWVVVSAMARGGRLESEQEHCPPQGKEWAAKVLRTVLNQKVLFPNGR